MEPTHPDRRSSVRHAHRVAVLHRIEALPGASRYAVSFRRADGAEQTAVLDVSADGVKVAEAGLPAGWTPDSTAFLAVVDAVLAVERARGFGPDTASLADVEGGWDVMMGNVVLGADAVPACTAHGRMRLAAQDVFSCAECGARAAYITASRPAH
jgi:hypothetical protein